MGQSPTRLARAPRYLYLMLLRRVAFPDFCEPCLPSPAAKPPAGAGWLTHSARPPSTVTISLPCGVVVSAQLSFNERKPAATAGGWSKMSDEPLAREREPIERVRARIEALVMANAAPRCGARFL